MMGRKDRESPLRFSGAVLLGTHRGCALTGAPPWGKLPRESPIGAERGDQIAERRGCSTHPNGSPPLLTSKRPSPIANMGLATSLEQAQSTQPGTQPEIACLDLVR